jgi:hypothetical protein
MTNESQFCDCPSDEDEHRVSDNPVWRVTDHDTNACSQRTIL